MIMGQFNLATGAGVITMQSFYKLITKIPSALIVRK